MGVPKSKILELIQGPFLRYGIIDDEHIWLALKKLRRDDSNTCNGFQRPVNRLVSTPDLSALPKLARSINKIHHANVALKQLFLIRYIVRNESTIFCEQLVVVAVLQPYLTY